jgi:hypothetical protein
LHNGDKAITAGIGKDSEIIVVLVKIEEVGIDGTGIGVMYNY